MKKYNIHSLKVVKIKKGNSSHYLICKYKESKDKYIEIFTSEKINIKNIINVEPLTNYRSILEKHNYQARKTLTLNKKNYYLYT